jgi:hypothetical protein
LVAVAVGWIVIEILRSFKNAGEVPWPSVPTIAYSVIYLTVGHVVAGLSWILIVQPFGYASGRVIASAGYFRSQLGKYVPGGVLQIASLFDVARRGGLSRGEASTAVFSLNIFVTMTPSALVAIAAAVLLPDVEMSWRVLVVLLALSALIAVWKIDKLSTIARAKFHRLENWLPLAEQLPGGGARLRLVGLGLASSTSVGVGFSILVQDHQVKLLYLTVGFLAAFFIGLILLPLPSGIGAREFMVLVLLASVAVEEKLFIATVLLRLLMILIEASMFVAIKAIELLKSR